MRISLLQAPVSKSDHAAGPSNAPVTLVEYGDYECPFCGQAVGIVKRLQEELGNDLRYVFRNFPLMRIHPHALDAARAAESAALQGKFWETHEALFENQDDLEEDTILEIAGGAVTDWNRFLLDLRNPAVDRKIQADLESGSRSRVGGTPTFFVNEALYTGEWDFHTLLEHLTRARDTAVDARNRIAASHRRIA
jgi:protein-disulfide isomerase